MSLTVPLSRLGEWTDASDNSTTGLVSIEQGVQTLGLNSQDNQREEILGWLSRVDIRPAHFAARVQQRQVSNKHSLFFRSDTYQAWLGDKGHILWLRGSRPATNYVVSVAIDEAEKLSWQKPTEGLGFAYYYFAHPIIEDFSPETVLRVLLAQLSEKAQSLPREIEALYNRSQDRDPTIDELLHTLQKTFLRNKHVYLAFDAIDTTPERAATFVHLLTRISCLSTNLSVIVSTKEENHVLESLLQCTTSMIVLEEFRVEHNLHACFQKRLHHDERYRGLSAQRKAEMHKIILTEDSGAFFASDRRLQLVATQLDIMAPFLTTPCFSTQLQNLPRTLNTAYDRILIGVDAPMFQMFYTILQWLAFSLRPLSIEEVIQVMSISCDSPQQDLLSIYNSRVLPILSSLAMFTSDNKLVRLHTCFKEYLTSKYIRESPCSRYRITESGSHCAIAHDCLRYLLKFHESSALPRKELLAQFPLLEYSARFWYRHSRTLTRLSSGSALDAKIHNLEMQLFRAQNEATLLNWLKISRPDSAMNDPEKEDLSAHLFSHTSELFGSPMYYAASCGLTSVVSNLIQQGHSAKTQAEHVDGCMYPGPLEAAVENGFSDIAELLLEADARPNIWTQEGGTCLLRACRKGDGKISHLLIEYGAKVDVWMKDGSTPLHCAASVGAVDLIHLLCEHGAKIDARSDIETTPLQEALLARHSDAVVALVEKGANLEAATKKSMRTDRSGGLFNLFAVTDEQDSEACREIQDSFQRTPLYIAVVKNDLISVKTLISHGAHVNACTSSGATPLFAATHKGYIDIMKFLLEHGADPKALPHSRATLLHAAAESGKPDVIKFTFALGMDPAALDDWEDTAFMRAVSRSTLPAVKAFSELGCGVREVKAVSDMTLLHFAALRGSAEITAFLLGKGLDIEARNLQGGRPLHLAANMGHPKVVDLLLRNGADVDALHFEKWTALRAAVSGCKERANEVVEILLHRPRPANLEIKDHHGYSVLQVAVHQGNQTMTQILLQEGANPNSQTEEGVTALHHAVDHQRDLVPLLLRYGARADIEDDHGLNCLARPVYKDDSELVETLMAGQGDRNALFNALELNSINGRNINFNDMSVFTWALIQGREVVTWMIFRYGSITANTPVAVPGLETTYPPLFLAVEFKRANIVKLLLRQGVDAMTKIQALCIAAGKGLTDSVEALLDHGVHVNGMNDGGITPLRLALANRHDDTVRLLCSRSADLAVEEDALDLTVVIGPKQIFYSTRDQR